RARQPPHRSAHRARLPSRSGGGVQVVRARPSPGGRARRASFRRAKHQGSAVNVAVVDLGLGNLGSVPQALRRAGGEPMLVTEPSSVAKAPRVILPGVAAFGLGMERAAPFRAALQQAVARRVPVLGICLGMQLLFDEGDEDGTRPGLGLLPGRVTRLPAGVQAPHIGWQQLKGKAESALRPQGWAYFAHSYRCEAPREVTHAVAEHGQVTIAAAVGRGTLFGVQYHPEKSAGDGEALLRRFLSLPSGAT